MLPYEYWVSVLRICRYVYLGDGDDLLVPPRGERVVGDLPHVGADQERRRHDRPHRELRARLQLRVHEPALRRLERPRHEPVPGEEEGEEARREKGRGAML